MRKDPPRIAKTNQRAVAGFLAPFISAGVTGLLILMGEEAFTELRFFIPYLFLVPAVLVAGLVLSIQSLSYVEELGDKDYAYSGLALNLFCLFFFVLSLVYVFRFAPG